MNSVEPTKESITMIGHSWISSSRSRALGLGLWTLCGLMAASSYAQDYPSKPIRVIVPLAPGGVADTVSRIFGQKLGEAAKQPVITDNRPGALGIIGAEAAARAAADGYTLFMGVSSTLTVIPHLRSKLPFDSIRDFVAVSHIISIANLLVINPSVPASSVKELVALAKSKPGALSYASQGFGSSGHLAAEQFKLATGIDILHVPFQGAAPAVQALIGDQVSMSFDTPIVSLAHVRAGTLRALAIESVERVSAAPEVPTMAEAGFPGLESGVWFGLLAPAGTPKSIVEFLNHATRKIFSEPEVRERFVSQGAVLPLGSSEQFGAFISEELRRSGQIVKDADIRME